MTTYIIRNLPDDYHRKLKHLAIDAGVTLNQLILRIIREAIEKSKPAS